MADRNQALILFAEAHIISTVEHKPWESTGVSLYHGDAYHLVQALGFFLFVVLLFGCFFLNFLVRLTAPGGRESAERLWVGYLERDEREQVRSPVA